MKIYIKEDTKNSDALWMVIEGDKPANLEGIMGVARDEDSVGNVAYAILKEEVEAIRDACNEWLTKQV